jgi:creatinine amidohydrolase
MKPTVFLKDMTWPEVQQAIQENRILIFAVGTMEQHGYHMPLGVDIYLPEEVARRVAEACGAVVAPVTQYGYKSLLRAGGGPHFPGSVGLRGATLITVVKDLMEGYLTMGWRRILVLDWHLENVPFVYEGVDEALRASGLGEAVKIVKIDNPNGLGVAAMPGLEAELFGDDFPGWAVEHAAIWETSAMLATRPDLVHPDRIVDGEPPAPFDYDVLPVPADAAPKSGVFWKATRASQEKGIKILEATTKGILQVINKEFSL